MNPPAVHPVDATPEPSEHLEAIERLLAVRHEEGAHPDDAVLAAQLRARLADMHPADVAYVLEGLPLDDRLFVWGRVPGDQEGEILLEVSDAVRDTLLADMDSAEIVAATQNLDA
ncbi:MAG TPA: hypothetical protein VFU92_05515, partial [Usitatibacter sp.]|nr:hypothetical protein [Usitatibacter sp.]